MSTNGGRIGPRSSVSPSAASGIWNLTTHQQERGASNWTGALGTQSSPATSAIQLRNAGLPSGDYWIKPSNYSGAAVNVWCDMTNLGGGWVLIGKGRQSNDDNGGWFGTENELNLSGLTQANAFSAGISKVSSSFVNYLMNGTANGWQNGNANNYLVVNRISNATDGYSGIGDSLYHKITNQSQFAWINQFGSRTTDNSSAATGTGTNSRYNSIWHGGGQYGSSESTFNDNYYGGPNSTNRSFTWKWGGHGGFHGWSSGNGETRGFQNSSESHAIQFVQLWAR